MGRAGRRARWASCCAASACASVMKPFFGHAAQRVVAALRGPLLVDVRALALRQLQDAGDGRGLLEIQDLHGLAEVDPRRGLDAVRAVAEVHLVAVEREDLLLGVPLLDLQGEHDLLDLALERLLRLEEQLAGELLRQRAGARIEQPAFVHEVADDGHQQAQRPDADVVLELGVLGRQDRLPHKGRDFLVLQDDPPLRGELADHAPVDRVDAGDGARLVFVEGRHLRQVPGVGDKDARQDAQRRRDARTGRRWWPGGRATRATRSDGPSIRRAATAPRRWRRRASAARL